MICILGPEFGLKHRYFALHLTEKVFFKHCSPLRYQIYQISFPLKDISKHILLLINVRLVFKRKSSNMQSTFLRYHHTRQNLICLKTKIILSYALHCPWKENMFAQSNLSCSAPQIPQNFLSSLLCFLTNCSKFCCDDTLFSKMSNTIKTRYNT